MFSALFVALRTPYSVLVTQQVRLIKFILVNYVSGAAPQRGVAAPERAPDFCFTSFYIYLYVFI